MPRHNFPPKRRKKNRAHRMKRLPRAVRRARVNRKGTS